MSVLRGMLLHSYRVCHNMPKNENTFYQSNVVLAITFYSRKESLSFSKGMSVLREMLFHSSWECHNFPKGNNVLSK